MVWRSVIPAVERSLDGLIGEAKTLSDDAGKASGSIKLDSKVEIPRNVSAPLVALRESIKIEAYHVYYTCLRAIFWWSRRRHP
jgi:hypothetical protein